MSEQDPIICADVGIDVSQIPLLLVVWYCEKINKINTIPGQK